MGREMAEQVKHWCHKFNDLFLLLVFLLLFLVDFVYLFVFVDYYVAQTSLDITV